MSLGFGLGSKGFYVGEDFPEYIEKRNRRGGEAIEKRRIAARTMPAEHWFFRHMQASDKLFARGDRQSRTTKIEKMDAAQVVQHCFSLAAKANEITAIMAMASHAFAVDGLCQLDRPAYGATFTSKSEGFFHRSRT